MSTTIITRPGHTTAVHIYVRWILSLLVAPSQYVNRRLLFVCHVPSVQQGMRSNTGRELFCGARVGLVCVCVVLVCTVPQDRRQSRSLSRKRPQVIENRTCAKKARSH